MRASIPRAGAGLVLGVLATGLAAGPASAQPAPEGHTLAWNGEDPRPAASIDDAAWLAGRWVGQGLGATVEEVWLPPVDGSMSGVFRLVRGGAVEFYELVVLVEEGGSLTLRLKHFEPDLAGWEGEVEAVSFPLVRRTAGALWFDGLTMRRLGEDGMRVWVALQRRGGGVREALFEYRRVGGPGPPP